MLIVKCFVSFCFSENCCFLLHFGSFTVYEYGMFLFSHFVHLYCSVHNIYLSASLTIYRFMHLSIYIYLSIYTYIIYIYILYTIIYIYISDILLYIIICTICTCVCNLYIYEYVYVWYSFWAKVFRFHEEGWMGFELITPAYWGHTQTTELFGRIMKCA